MGRKQNLELLAAAYTPKKAIPLTDYEALRDWFFNKDISINSCARKAYRDIQRNLRGIGELDKTAKTAYFNASVQLIAQSITALLSSKTQSEAAFDAWHKEVCTKLCQTAISHKLKLDNPFTYGLAQKWLNITFKNMMIAEKWDDQLNAIKAFLHVPVDNVILCAAASLGVKRQTALPWSKWSESEYIAFQTEVRKAIKQSNYNTPIDWEFIAWQPIAKAQ